ncbi:MAG: hypothetical protein Q9170_002163 [Blastenia crenularia]
MSAQCRKEINDTLTGAHSWYNGTNMKPEFVFKRGEIEPGHCKLVVLPDTWGNYPKDPNAPRGKLIAEEWDDEHCYWTMNVDGKTWIVYQHGPTSNGKAPYRGILHSGARKGYEDKNLAFDLPPSNNSAGSYPSHSGYERSVEPENKSNAPNSSLFQHVTSPEIPVSDHGPKPSGNGPTDPPARKRAGTTNADAPQKKTKLGNGLDPEVQRTDDDSLDPGVKRKVDEALFNYGFLHKKPSFVQGGKNSKGIDFVPAYVIRADGEETREIVHVEKKKFPGEHIYWVARVHGEQEILERIPGGIGGSRFCIWREDDESTDGEGEGEDKAIEKRHPVAPLLTQKELEKLDDNSAPLSHTNNDLHTLRSNKLNSFAFTDNQARLMPRAFQGTHPAPYSREARGMGFNAAAGQNHKEVQVGTKNNDVQQEDSQNAGALLSSAFNKKVPACIRCNFKHLGCDRAVPTCGFCEKINAQCVYPDPGHGAASQATKSSGGLEANAVPPHLVNELEENQTQRAGSRRSQRPKRKPCDISAHKKKASSTNVRRNEGLEKMKAQITLWSNLSIYC